MTQCSFLVLELPECGPGLRFEAYWRGSWVDTYGFCTGRVREVGQQQVENALQVTPRLVAGEFPVLLICMPKYALGHSGLLWKMHIGCILGPAGSVKSISVYVTLWPLHALACSLVFPYQCPAPAGGWDQVPSMPAFPCGPCTLCDRQPLFKPKKMLTFLGK